MNGRMPILAALLALAACGDEDQTPQHFTAAIEDASTSVDDTAARPAPVVPDPPDTPAVPAPPQITIPISLAPVGRATVRGSGEAKAVVKSTSISISLAQAIAGATYEGAVRQGTCGGVGSTIASLYPVTADSLGVGRAASDVSIPIDSLAKRPHVVVYGRGGRPEACAPIGAASAPVPPTLRPAAPPPTEVPKQSDDPPPDSAKGRGQSD
jgi:hypothetical protein